MPNQYIQQATEDLRSDLITPTALLAETLERLDQLDSDIQAFVTVMRDQAYEEAEKAENEQRTGLFRSPLHGIPIAIKDIIAVKDVWMTAGSKVLAEYVPQEDATVVEQLRRAGAVIVGKTNTHEFAYGTYTPPTRNPWNLLHIAGGSSGGSAASVAAGMCPGAIGSDTGGSIRIPSACCGATGLKPTYGRVSTYGVIPLSWSLDHVGPIARSAEDCAILFDAIASYDLRAQQQRRTFSSNLRSRMQGMHALVLPTLPMPAIRIDQAGTDILIDGVTQNATVALLRLTMPYNLAGLPAISLSCGFSSGGLPIGLQIVGKPFEEAMILRIAHAYQQLTDWHRREINVQPKI